MRDAREVAGLSQAELAARVDATRQTIGLIEAGRYNPSLRLCTAICRTLGVQPWDVIPFSSVTRDGKDKLLTRLGEIIRQAEGQA